MSKYFKIEGENIKREFESCPKCGPGYFMGVHSDRKTCGKCGNTEFKGKTKGRKRSKKK